MNYREFYYALKAKEDKGEIHTVSNGYYTRSWNGAIHFTDTSDPTNVHKYLVLLFSTDLDWEAIQKEK